MTIRGKRISKQQEELSASELGGRTQANSGATRLGGGADVRANGIRLECKVTEKDYYSLKLSDLEKLRKQAAKTVEQPVFQIAFRSLIGAMDRYAIIYGFDSVDEREIETEVIQTKSIKLWQWKLQITLAKRRLRLMFFNPKKAKSDQFEIIPWDTFLESRSA